MQKITKFLQVVPKKNSGKTNKQANEKASGGYFTGPYHVVAPFIQHVRKIFQKSNFSYPLLRNVSFPENSMYVL